MAQTLQITFLVGRSERLRMKFSADENENVIPLFHTEMVNDPLQSLIDEMERVDEVEASNEALGQRLLVTEKQFPDQSMYILDKQLEMISERIDRLKFYLNDLNDLLPSRY
ncbi:MAG: hypothetical protein AB7I27_11645 [Bacteriovoracaceae bacterium]